eukprot:TRINITY_DN39288_c0_g1_i2.p1 TRINITY_DN39288_c0_g1~~TRINITY_DN39288_c0_g1_i2.p1  ORF type:complete len:200 (+),score=7.98 TRINITY_DN39288_c0_g1_i2:64-663(+)
MRLVVVGLGNPWPVPRLSRHNLGALLVNAIADSLGLTWSWQWTSFCWVAEHDATEHGHTAWPRDIDLALVQPALPYNICGPAITRALAQLDADPGDMVVMHDDIDVAPGRFLAKSKGSSGGCRGMQSVMDSVGSDKVHRLRLGVGRPASGTRNQAEIATYVLSEIEPELLETWRSLAEPSAQDGNPGTLLEEAIRLRRT